jgi:hypothetical protein
MQISCTALCMSGMRVCMYCMCVHTTHARMQISNAFVTWAHTQIDTPMCLVTHVHTYIHTHTHKVTLTHTLTHTRSHIHTHKPGRTHIHTHQVTHTYTHTRSHTQTRTHKPGYTYIYTHIFSSITVIVNCDIHTCIWHKNVYACVYVCKSTYIHVCLCTHTHTHKDLSNKSGFMHTCGIPYECLNPCTQTQCYKQDLLRPVVAKLLQWKDRRHARTQCNKQDMIWPFVAQFCSEKRQKAVAEIMGKRKMLKLRLKKKDDNGNTIKNGGGWYV